MRFLTCIPFLMSMAVVTEAMELRFNIQPGPAEMSAEERAIESDPVAGLEHAVILTQESSRDDSMATGYETIFHLRAKILSNQARELADLEIPISDKGRLVNWWARTLLPDGTVLQVPMDELKRQPLARQRGRASYVMKAALPGVVPGCVIDYGYRIIEPGYLRFDRIPLQVPWPIRSLRYVWVPYARLKGAYRIARGEGLDITADQNRKRIVWEARNLPAVEEEPMMPPYDEVRSALYIYYLPAGATFDTYWKDAARRYESRVKASYSKASVRDALQRIRPAPEGSLDDKLRAIYDWLANNVTRSGTRSFEEKRQETDDNDNPRDSVRQILDTYQGSSWDLHVAFIALARQVGADAWMVLASDRTDHYWDQELRSTDQFDTQIATVGHPGTAISEMILVDVGSGLDYGRIPWWIAGIQGFVTGPRPSPVLLQDAMAVDNRAVIDVDVRFEEENEFLVIHWNWKGSGQVGLSERHYFRGLAPRDRKTQIERLCGGSARVDVVASTVDGIDSLTVPYALRCETEAETDLTETVSRYQMSWSGPWIRAFPDLPMEQRQHPILFRFPRVEVVNVRIEAPEGFVPQEVPPTQTLQGPASAYKVEFKRTESGYEVRRQFAVQGVGLPPSEYDAFRTFVGQVDKADRTPLMFVRGKPES